MLVFSQEQSRHQCSAESFGSSNALQSTAEDWEGAAGNLVRFFPFYLIQVYLCICVFVYLWLGTFEGAAGNLARFFPFYSIQVYLCVCVFVYLCICVFVYLCISLFVY